MKQQSLTRQVISILFLIAIFIITAKYARLAPTPSPTSPAPSVTTSPRPQTAYVYTAELNNTNAYELVSQKVVLGTKDYGQSGMFIESVNGLQGDSTHYWALYINHAYAEQGIAQTTLNAGDVIELKYETITQ